MADEQTPTEKPLRKRKSVKAAKRKKSGPRRSTEGAAPGGAWTFPKHTLEKAIEVAQALEEKNAGKPLKAADFAPLLGFKRVQDWRYQDLLRSANQYGLVQGSGRAATIELTHSGRTSSRRVHPVSDRKRSWRRSTTSTYSKTSPPFTLGSAFPRTSFSETRSFATSR
jgi:hypothetical protein